jgi:hypothetical protein
MARQKLFGPQSQLPAPSVILDSIGNGLNDEINEFANILQMTLQSKLRRFGGAVNIVGAATFVDKARFALQE